MKRETDSIFNRPLPASIDAERAVLGSIIINGDAIERVSPIVDPADFFSDQHREIFAALLDMRERGQAIDWLTLKNALGRERLTAIGGAAFVSGLTDGIPDIANVERYARIVKETARLRELVAIAIETARRALDRESATDIAADVCNRVESVTATGEARNVLPLDEAIDRVRALYETGGVKRGASTGWPTLNEHYTVARGAWTLVTGIPGHGKSGFLDALTLNVAQLHDWHVVMFSAENYPPESHIASMLEKFSQLPFNEGPTTRMSRDTMEDALAFIRSHYRFIDPATEKLTLDSILSTASALSKTRAVNVLTIDPWNELQHDRAEGITETEYISASLTKIRRWARQHDAHVYLVVHPQKMQRDRDTGTYAVPTPYDASGSAHWRNKADYALTLWSNITANGYEDMVQVHIQKVRRREIGRVGMVELRYDKVTGAYLDPKMPRLFRQKSA